LFDCEKLAQGVGRITYRFCFFGGHPKSGEILAQRVVTKTLGKFGEIRLKMLPKHLPAPTSKQASMAGNAARVVVYVGKEA